MHKEILTKEQVALLPLVAQFKSEFGLVGGTAIALHIGHRESIDFDLFSHKEFGNLSLRRRIEKFHTISQIIVNKKSEFTFIINGVQCTFFQYPFEIQYSENFGNAFRMPKLLTLAAMKAYALGQRAKWKDYVDLYFIMRDFHPLVEIIREAETIFGKSFNAKLIRQQLSYFDDVSYKEAVVYKPGFEVPDEEVKRALEEYSLS
ncbi:MAG: hypothetical protein UY86_C0012G0004 [Candidatus Adlerbacteria bacterium GW2011_GWB1_54_7]|uniref:Nucleotidyl transferase AbiEii toxin, Type IV TA system n=1 Tax=Candidatus Adlerbacteria bacterium GW2011_GWB1_54_7 TaxID=1618607 RepID=A0A0G2A8K7_9BACT|nr:MAG: hypothetical protein UY86_C0012G0004 [Candidatus Adlerbacteria bacterium GW2011_GWB1_54_7]